MSRPWASIIHRKRRVTKRRVMRDIYQWRIDMVRALGSHDRWSVPATVAAWHPWRHHETPLRLRRMRAWRTS